MKTTLPERSSTIKERLDRIVTEILAVAKDQIAMVILFGSYARGNWVRDHYTEGHILYSYESDIDILVVTKGPCTDSQRNLLKKRMEERLQRAGLGHRPLLTPPVTIIIETIQHFNAELERSRYFFLDIKKEGILLYNSGDFELAEPRVLTWKERKEIAKDDFDEWFYSGSEFLIDARNALQRNSLKKGAFYLHQATENFYSAILLVFSGYKGKLHDILTLGSLASNYSDELLKILPRDTPERDRCFILLQEAYVKARYDKNYKITLEQLQYLVQRVEKLKLLTEEICQAWINQDR